MKTRHMLLVSFLLTLVIGLLFAWPLPQHVATGIPCSATNVEKGAVRSMIAGDHLQLLYNYWIFSDMLSGKTRFFHNLYEFNTGDDDERRYVGLDLQPFSLVFTAGYWLGGRAVGWNLMGFVSLWMTCFCTWLLVARFVRSGLIAALASVVSITLPYRWVTLLGGSPTGLAMMTVPMLLLGLTVAVRERRVWGGIVAALAILFAQWNDAHVLMFGMMLAPCWCLLVLAGNRDIPWRDYRYWLKMVVAMLPFALIAGVIVWTMMGKGDEIGATTVAAGRSLAEVGLYSPKAVGLIGWRYAGHENSVYLGYTIGVMALGGLICWLLCLLKDRPAPFREALTWGALLLACVGVVLLALGPNGPRDGYAFRLLRRSIPHFDMIRQPAKIYALLPSLLALFIGMSMQACSRIVPRRSQYVLLVGLVLGLIVEHARQIRPTVCLLDDHQDAYAAVANDAHAEGKDARVIVIPIWPGDSAWASLYQHYVSLYRIRMMNGYLPVVPQKYVREIAGVFEFLNGGIVTDELLDKLLARGVDYVMLHEDAFPEQCSTFSVGFTLMRFLTHSRLSLLKQGQNVWAFKIHDGPHDARGVVPDWPLFTPSYNASHEAEHCRNQGVELVHEPATSGDHFVSVVQNGSVMIPSFYHCSAPHPMLFVRARGEATLDMTLAFDEGATYTAAFEVHSGGAWRWVPVDMVLSATGQQVEVTLSVRHGTVDIDRMVYGSGRIPDLGVGEQFYLPAAVLCHAGYTDLEADAVQLRADCQSTGNRGGVIYGPNIPIATGRYRLEVKYSTEAPAGVDLGFFFVHDGQTCTPDVRMVVGQPSVGEFSFGEKSALLRFVLNYSRNADMKVHGITLTRLE